MNSVFRISCSRVLLVCLTLALGLGSGRAEWQWSVSVDSVISPETKAPPRAFLWIPADCKRVRAVVVGQHNMLEEGILEHPRFRKELARLGIAEIWITPSLDTWQSATNNDSANRNFDSMLKALANESGYSELEFAPIVPIGHSAMASFPWNFAAWNPSRTLAVLSIHGDAPQTQLVGNGRPNANWGDRKIDGIPGLMAMGEYEWWEDRLAPAIKFRAQHPASPIAMLAEPGRGHFDHSDQLVDYLALFIRKAAEQRLPAVVAQTSKSAVSRVSKPAAAESSTDVPTWPPSRRSGALARREGGKSATQQVWKPATLVPVDPRAGWLVDRWRKDEKPHSPAAPYAKYQGDPNQAFWSFDRELALLAQNYGADQRGKSPQMLGFVQDGKVVPQTPGTHEQVRLKFLPLADGITFKLGATFLDAVAEGGNPAKWTGLTNGAPLGHATGGGPVKISRICGPVRQISDDTFAISFYRMGISRSRRAGDIWLLAEHPGDDKFKSAVQQANLRIPAFNTEGAEQRLTFPEIPGVKRGTKLLKLNATSSAAVPVYYFVREGPAEIEGDTLRFTKIPPRAKFPVKVTVVAWHYGWSFEPKLKSAEPVERTFNIQE